jgi:uncharacterized protein (TIGR03437 family)
MKINQILCWKLTTLFAALPVIILSYGSGPDPRKTGAPGDNTCAQATCHTGTAVNAGGGRVELVFPGDLVYQPGVRQRLQVKISDSAALHGFQATARLGSNETNGQAGRFDPIDSATFVMCENGSARPAGGDCPQQAPLQFIEHAQAAQSGTFTFEWTPPASDVGSIRMYVAGNAANGNRMATGDRIYTASYTLMPASTQPKPQVNSQNGVVNSAGFQPGVAAGSWISIFGQNLAPVTRTWDAAKEIVDGKLPVSLDGVSVSINNKPAFVHFISPTQINVQAPSDDALGPVQVTVTHAGGTSDAVAASVQTFLPGFFLFPQNHVAAVRPNGTFVGPAGLFSGLTTTPAKPGDVVLLFGTGFGPTNPGVPAGQVFQGAAALANPVAVRIGGASANVAFAGLSAAGLYQFNLTIPDLPDGVHEVVAEIGGARTQTGARIQIQR